jgi:urea carboxylase
MIFDRPRFLPAGERYWLLELGDEMNLLLSFKAIAICRKVGEHAIAGVVEAVPGLISVLVHYDPGRVKRADLQRELESIVDEVGNVEQIEAESRLIDIPVLYDDPWTQACIDDYSKRIHPVPNNVAFVAEANGLTVPELIRVHSRPQYWVASLGTWPGLPFNFPMDPGYPIAAPKYNPARTWTPERAIGFGGACTSIYSVDSPGGYQLLGRTPIPIWDPDSRLPEFGGSPALLRTGDRVKFVPIGRQEYDEIDTLVAEGRFRINIIDYERVSVRAYAESARRRDAASPTVPAG